MALLLGHLFTILFSKTRPSDKPDHSCENNLLTVVHDKLKEVLNISLSNTVFSKLAF